VSLHRWVRRGQGNRSQNGPQKKENGGGNHPSMKMGRTISPGRVLGIKLGGGVIAADFASNGERGGQEEKGRCQPGGKGKAETRRNAGEQQIKTKELEKSKMGGKKKNTEKLTWRNISVKRENNDEKQLGWNGRVKTKQGMKKGKGQITSSLSRGTAWAFRGLLKKQKGPEGVVTE